MGKPNVLLLTPRAPLPLDAGSRRIWTACRFLRDRYDFSLLHLFNPRAWRPAASSSPGDRAQAGAIRLAQEAHFFQDVFRRTHSVAHAYESSGDGRWPEEVERFYSQSMADALERVVVQDKIDLVHVEYDVMAPYVRILKARFPGLPCLLTHHDMGSVSLSHSYFRELADWRRFLRLPEWRRRVLFTRDMCRRFDSVVTVSEDDGRLLRRLAPDVKVEVVATGVDLEHFRSTPPREARASKTVIYVGHYLHYPNEDAVLWFAREILPRLWAEDPEIRFQIVGTEPTEAVRELARRDARVTVTGKVPDVREYEEKAVAMVAPLRLGKGIKGKILEGMATGTPVVATSLANEGIRAEDGRQILLADSPAAFSRQVLRVVRDARLWSELASAGRALVESRHSWEQRARELDRVYRDACRAPGK